MTENNSKNSVPDQSEIMQNKDDQNTTADSESLDEEVEPKLKYARMLSNLKENEVNKIPHLQDLLQKDAASCIAVHEKLVCLGTHWGSVHLLDHQGNVSRTLASHSVAVNQISIDGLGETIASCSDDGKVHIISLFASKEECEQTLNIGRLVKGVVLDPVVSGGRRLIVGHEHLTLYERSGFLGRWKAAVLCESEGHVTGLAWSGDFVAWASSVGVRVYDMVARCSLGLIRWESPMASSYKCHLRWSDRTLFIGWVDTVRVCVIRRRNTHELGLPERIVDPISTFRTDFLVSGVAPLGEQLVLLGVPRKSGTISARPQLHVVEYRDSEYTELCCDNLSLRGYQNWNCEDYHLDVLSEEDRLFVVAPKDLVIASPYEPDDRINWLIQHSRFEDALTVHSMHPCRKYTAAIIGGAYLDYLLAEQRFQEAAKLCLRVFKQDCGLWQEHIYKFARIQQLHAVAKYLPRDSKQSLDPHVYEMVLYEYLRLDPKGFLLLVREWNERGLYNTAAVINLVLETLMNAENAEKKILMEALAILYENDSSYDKALTMYLKLGHPGAFQLIRKYHLQEVVYGMIVNLMQLDIDQTCDLLLDKSTQVPPEIVVKCLQDHKSLLYAYLRALDRQEPKLSIPYHGLMVRLYSIFGREQLLPFLKRSDKYPIQEALEICQEQRFYPEMVYLLGRIGDTREALDLINRELKDVQQALDFCQEHDDPDLWQALIEHSLAYPEVIKYLLPRIGSYVDPWELVRRIKPGASIPGLRAALISMLHQSRLQVNIQESCQKLLVGDYWNLHERLVTTQTKGLAVREDSMCGACHKRLLAAPDSQNSRPLIIYNCRHSFHEQCLPALSEDRQFCAICHPHQSQIANR